MDNNEIKSNLLSVPHWIRLVFMVLFALVLQVVGSVVMLLVFVQFLFSLITGKSNSALQELGSSLSKFIYQALAFLTYNSEEKPFPFADWPTPEKHKAESSPSQAPADASAVKATAKKPEKLKTDEALEAEDSIKQEDA